MKKELEQKRDEFLNTLQGQAEPIINYVKNLKVKNSYELDFEFSKIKRIINSDYSKVYEELRQKSDVIKMSNLSDLLIDSEYISDINGEIDSIINKKLDYFENDWNEYNCDCGFEGEFQSTLDFYICPDCGSGYGENFVVQETNKGRSFKEIIEKRHHAPMDYEFGENKTNICNKIVDKYGKTFSPFEKNRANRLRYWHNRLNYVSSLSKNLKKASPVFEYYISLDYPKEIIKHAIPLYSKFAELYGARSTGIELGAATSIYLILKRNNLPKSKKSFINDFPWLITVVSKDNEIKRRRAKVKDLAKAIKKYIELLPEVFDFLKNDKKISWYEIQEDFDLNFYERKVCEKMNKYFLKFAKGKDPKGIAAASIYTVLNNTYKKKTQKELSDYFLIRETTVRNKYLERKNEEITNKIIDQGWNFIETELIKDSKKDEFFIQKYETVKDYIKKNENPEKEEIKKILKNQLYIDYFIYRIKEEKRIVFDLKDFKKNLK